MIDFHKEMVSALKTILPVHYEMALTSKTKAPCISYMETNNFSDTSGNTIGYSKISYQIKVWGNDIDLLQEYALEIDKVLRPIGFKRTSARELYDNQSTMIQKVMNYEALALENY